MDYLLVHTHTHRIGKNPACFIISDVSCIFTCGSANDFYLFSVYRKAIYDAFDKFCLKYPHLH